MDSPKESLGNSRREREFYWLFPRKFLAPVVVGVVAAVAVVVVVVVAVAVAVVVVHSKNWSKSTNTSKRWRISERRPHVTLPGY